MKRWGIFVLVLLSSGCAADTQLLEINRKQAATIDALNHEISRLNSELDHLAQSSSRRATASESAPRPYEK